MNQFQKGKIYICTLSKSPGYKVGKEYQTFVNAKGILCLRGDDGFEDPVTMLQSGFKEARD